MYFDSDNRRNNNKTMAELERQQERLVRIYNSVFHAISDMKSSKDYLSTRNLLNVFSSEEGVNTFDIYKLRKMLDSKVVELLEENEKQMQNIQKDIDNIKSIKVEESTEQLKELDLRSNNILYKYMSLLHMNGFKKTVIGGALVVGRKHQHEKKQLHFKSFAPYLNTLDCSQRNRELLL